MILFVLIAFALFQNMPQPDETVRAYGAADKEWRLVELAGAEITVEITLTFPQPGNISGSAPCNHYAASMRVPYPWFEVGPIAATRRMCPEIETETAYFDALSEATLSEVLNNTLILSNNEHVLLVFKADD